MREILFRGKRIDNGEWAYGSFLQVEHEDGSFTTAVFSKKDAGGDAEVAPSTVGQYTGLTDKNGKRIFEGDILKSHYDSLFPDDVTFELVVFCDSAWCIQQKGFEPAPACADMISELSEVAGNIYDNPELLERGTP